jgi:periplasmic protein TonB
MSTALPATLVTLSWRRWLKEPLFWGLMVSTLAHVLLLAIRFVPPPPLMIRPMDSQLEVVLLNAGNDVKPRSAEVVAQISMEAGGDRDKGRAKSPLPADEKAAVGQELREQARRQQELEQQQLQLLAQLKPGASTNPEAVQRNPDPSTEAPDPADTRAVIAMLQAQISKDIDAYSKRPRRLTFGVNAIGVTFARYVDDWAAKIEELGTDRYPPEARGKFYDSLIVTVEIRRDGSVANFIINKPSRHAVLNQAVKRIIYSGQPYERFSADMAKDGDILQIVRTWTFTNDGLETESVNPASLAPVTSR